MSDYPYRVMTAEQICAALLERLSLLEKDHFTHTLNLKIAKAIDADTTAPQSAIANHERAVAVVVAELERARAEQAA